MGSYWGLRWDTGQVAWLSAACGGARLTDGLFLFGEDADSLSGPWWNGKYYSYSHISPRHSSNWELHTRQLSCRQREREKEREGSSIMFKAMVHEIRTKSYKYLIVKLHFTSICSISWVVFNCWAMVEKDVEWLLWDMSGIWVLSVKARKIELCKMFTDAHGIWMQEVLSKVTY